MSAALAEIWLGCGEEGWANEAAVKAFVRWNMLNGELLGPRLTNGRTNDHKSPFSIEELPEYYLYIADLGFFAIERLCSIARYKNDGRKKNGKRYFVSRLQPHTNLYNRRGHLLKLKGMLPQQVGQVCEMGAVLGHKNGVPVRLILLRVPKEVAEERQARIIEKAKDNGNEPSKEILELAHWTIMQRPFKETRGGTDQSSEAGPSKTPEQKDQNLEKLRRDHGYTKPDISSDPSVSQKYTQRDIVLSIREINFIDKKSIRKLAKWAEKQKKQEKDQKIQTEHYNLYDSAIFIDFRVNSGHCAKSAIDTKDREGPKIAQAWGDVKELLNITAEPLLSIEPRGDSE